VTPDRDRAAFVDPLDRAEPVIAHLAVTLDVESTPLSAYAALDDYSDYGFLLESAEKTPSSDPEGAFTADGEGADRHARYSFVGYDPDAVVSVTGSETTVESLGGPAADLVADAAGTADPDADVLDALRTAFPDLDRVRSEFLGLLFLCGRHMRLL